MPSPRLVEVRHRERGRTSPVGPGTAQRQPQNGHRNEHGNRKVGSAPPIQRDQVVEEPREDHGPSRQADTGSSPSDAAALDEPEIDDLLAYETEAADSCAAQQCEADQQHQARLDERHIGAG